MDSWASCTFTNILETVWLLIRRQRHNSGETSCQLLIIRPLWFSCTTLRYAITLINHKPTGLLIIAPITPVQLERCSARRAALSVGSPRSISAVLLASGSAVHLPGVSLYDSSCRLKRYHPQWDWHLTCSSFLYLSFVFFFQYSTKKNLIDSEKVYFFLNKNINTSAFAPIFHIWNKRSKFFFYEPKKLISLILFTN